MAEASAAAAKDCVMMVRATNRVVAASYMEATELTEPPEHLERLERLAVVVVGALDQIPVSSNIRAVVALEGQQGTHFARTHAL